MGSMSSKRRVVYIIVDGMGTEAFEQATASGRAPAFAFLKAHGHYVRDSIAVFPTITPAATARPPTMMHWTSASLRAVRRRAKSVNCGGMPSGLPGVPREQAKTTGTHKRCMTSAEVESGRPLAGISVDAYAIGAVGIGNEATTGSDGTFQIEDLNSTNGVTTLFSINNASASAAVAHVTVWTDLSVPVLDFDVYLTGFDVQTITMRSAEGRFSVQGKGRGQTPRFGKMEERRGRRCRHAHRSGEWDADLLLQPAGGDGADVLKGGSGADVLHGRDGDDRRAAERRRPAGNHGAPAPAHGSRRHRHERC